MIRTFFGAALAFTVHANAASLVVLGLGESQNLKVPSSFSIRVSNSKVVRIVDHGTSLQVSGRKIGQATLTHAKGAVEVQVVDVSVAKTYRAFTRLLQQMKGLKLDARNNQVIVSGELLRIRDWETLRLSQQETKGTWLMQARVDASLCSVLRSMLIAELEGQNLINPSIQLDPFPQLTVSPAQEKELKSNFQFLNMGLTLRGQAGTFDLKPNLRLKLILAEVHKSAADGLGLEFQDGQTVQWAPSFQGPQSILSTLNFLTQKGQARILATPSLVTQVGQEAEFHSGGEFAVRSRGVRSSATSWKKHGLWLKFKPQMDARKIVHIEIETEFSVPNFSNPVEGLPSLHISRTRSAINLALNSTARLSGLLRQQQGHWGSGLKGLSELPLLGRLFRSEDFQSQRSELQVLITPEAVPLTQQEQLQERKESWNWTSFKPPTIE